MPELLSLASCRKDWKRICAKSSLMFSWWLNWSRDWTELIFIIYFRALALIESHGGNPHLSSLIKELSKIYTQPQEPSSSGAQGNGTGQGPTDHQITQAKDS